MTVLPLAAAGLPAGLSVSYVLVGLAIMGAVTVLLRLAPFVALARLQNSRLVSYLGVAMPVGVMLALVLYTLRHLPEEPAAILPSLIGVGVTLIMQLRLRNTGASVAGGTISFMLAHWLL